MTNDETDITMALPWSMVSSSSDRRHGHMDDGDDDTDDDTGDDIDDDTDDAHDDDIDDDNDHKNDSYKIVLPKLFNLLNRWGGAFYATRQHA